MMHRVSQAVVGCLLVLVAGTATHANAQATPKPLLEVEPTLIEGHQTSSRTNAQGVRPYYVDDLIDPYIDNRGTGLDGSLRSAAPFGWAVNANPFASEWNDRARYREDFLINNGRYSPTAIDISLPAPGFSWTVGRTYSVPTDVPDYSTGYTGPLGYQGLDWHQSSQPEIVYVEAVGEDYIYLVYGADRFLEFKQLDEASDVYRGVNGAAGAVVADSVGSNNEFDTLTYWDQHGTRSVFFDPRDGDNIVTDLGQSNHDGQGQLWTITDAAGNKASVGHSTDPALAIEYGYDDTARIQVAYDTAGRKYEYTYSLIQGTGSSSSLSASLLTEIEVFEDYDTNTIWATTGSKVEYTYFTELKNRRGIFGNLEEVHIQIPLSGYDPETPALRVLTTKQRYWYETSTSDDDRGYIKAYVNPEGYRRFELAETEAISDIELTDSELVEYREFYITKRYDYVGSGTVLGRIRLAKWPGQPIDGSPSNSDHNNIEFEYYPYDTFADTAMSYDPEHRFSVSIEETAGGMHTHQYFDEAGQPLSYRIEASGSFPASAFSYPDMWIYVDREGPARSNSLNGVIWKIAWPLSIATADPNPSGGTYVPPCTIKNNTSGNLDGGPVQVFDRETSTSSAFRGFMLADQWQNGNSPLSTEDGPHPTYSYGFLAPTRDSAASVDVGGYLVIRPLLSFYKQHPGIDLGSGAPAIEDTTYSYEFHAEDLGGGGTTDPADPQWLSERKMVTSLPSVSTSQLGSGVSETLESYYRPDGTLVYHRAEDDVWSYFELQHNLTVKEIVDADLSQTSSFATGEVPSEYMAIVPSTSDAYHLIESWVRDDFGRTVEHTLPTGRVQTGYHSAIASGELTEVWSAKTSGGTHSGPAMYYAYDHIGYQIVNAEIAFSGGTTTAGLDSWIDESAMTPLVDAVDEGTLSSANTTLIDPSGSLLSANRSYHTLPLSGIGQRRLNFDEQWFEYDNARRTRGTAEMNGTIRTADYDPYGYMDGITLNSYNPGDGLINLGSEPSGSGDTLPNFCPEYCCAEIAAWPSPLDMSPQDFKSLDMSWFTKGCDASLVLTEGLTTVAGTLGVSYAQIDILSRAVFIVGPETPYEFREYDNLGRLVAIGSYKDIPTNFTEVASLPTKHSRSTPNVFTNFDERYDSPRTISSNRTALVEYEYTPRGQVYKVTHHEVDQATGAIGTGSLESVASVYGYDEAGRLIYSDSGQMVKQAFNRVGDLVDTYAVATTNDTAGDYSDLFDVVGDVVVGESHAAVDPETGNTHLLIRVDREPAISGFAQPLGQLDRSDYSDVSNLLVDASIVHGRAQIATYEFDELDRVTNRSMHGTADTENGTDFDPSSPPAGSLETSLTYGDDGRVIQVEDELGRIQERAYDLAGRTVQTIENAVSGGAAADENRKTEWEYQDTQLYKYKAYLDDTTAQVTTYSYGSPHSDPNLPDAVNLNPTNDYLRGVTYPDGKKEEFFYNNFGTLSYHIDRHDNEFKVHFDEGHRPQMMELLYAGPEHEDEEDQSIEIVYNNRGLIQSLTEVTSLASSGDVLSTVEIEYDGWGAVASFNQQDNWLDDLVGSSVVTERKILYNWESSHTGNPSTLRLDSIQYQGDPSTATDDTDLVFNYTGNTNSGLSRVTSMALNGVNVASYKYLGTDRVSRIDYPENDVYSTLRNASNSYDGIDQFNRVTRSRWNKTRASNQVPFYDTEVHYDDASNIIGLTDHIYTTDYNFNLVNDELNRLTQSKRGGGTGTAITALREQADWTLGKVGTWDAHALDLTGDLNYADTGEFQTDHTFDGTTPDLGINQIITIEEDTDNTPGYENTYTRSYDDRGNLTDAPDRNQEYVWDYLNRLIEIKADDNGTPRTVAEFRYNALGYRIAERLDSNGDGFLDKSVGNGGNGDDTVWRRLIYDARWRVVEVYELETDSGSESEDRVEVLVYHAAGFNGVGSGSYIDEAVLRDRDADKNGTLEERHYYCQNWHADVVAVVDAAGNQIEQTRYTPYGTPFAIPLADQDLSGSLDFFDVSAITTRVGSGVYDVRADIYLDGVLDFFDVSAFLAQYGALSGETFGRDVQSAYGHNIGYAGYWRIDDLRLSHVRYRWYDADTGSWMGKDPAGYVDGGSLYQYVGGMPFYFVDPLGLKGLQDQQSTGTKALRFFVTVTDAMYPEWLIDGATGAADAINPLNEPIRKLIGIDDGVNTDSRSYKIGTGVGIVIDTVSGGGIGKQGAKQGVKGFRRVICFFTKACFVDGTLVATEAEGNIPIELVGVGDVVVSTDDGFEEQADRWLLSDNQPVLADPDAWSQIQPDQWSLVDMRADFGDGVYILISALRPNAWVGDLIVGEHVGYYREGVGVIADVEILSISSCPDLPADTTGVVRATYETHGVGAVDLRFAGSDDVIGVTTNHPVYSLDRNSWVEVGDLWTGERLETGSGEPAIVEEVVLRAEGVVVYNFEVHGDHTYYVGEIELWAHNGTPPNEFGPNGGRRGDDDLRRLQRQQDSHDARKNAAGRERTGQNPDNPNSKNKGTSGDRPKGPAGSDRQKNIGVDEEHSKRAKGKGGDGVKPKAKPKAKVKLKPKCPG